MTSPHDNDADDANDSGLSGSRWEPTSGETAERPTMAQPVQTESGPAPRRSRTDVLRRQAPMAAVGAVFLLGGGVAGYALGHAGADDGGAGPAGRHGFTDSGQAGPGGGFDHDHDHWQQGPDQQGEDGPGFGQGAPPQNGEGGQDDGGGTGQGSSGTAS